MSDPIRIAACDSVPAINSRLNVLESIAQDLLQGAEDSKARHTKHALKLAAVSEQIQRVEDSALTEAKLEAILNRLVVRGLRAILTTIFLSAATIATGWATIIFGLQG